MIRFFPDEIKLVFPEIFNMDEKNKEFMQSKDLVGLINSMNKRLKDRQFDAFRNM